jgi:hypothetical protein
MTHEELQGRLLDLAYGELSPREAREVEAHAASCEACRAELARIQGTRRVMSALPVEPAPERGERVLVAAAREAAGRRRERGPVPRWLWRGALVALPVAAVLAVSVRIIDMRPKGREGPDALLGDSPYAARVESPPAAAPPPAREHEARDAFGFATPPPPAPHPAERKIAARPRSDEAAEANAMAAPAEATAPSPQPSPPLRGGEGGSGPAPAAPSPQPDPLLRGEGGSGPAPAAPRAAPAPPPSASADVGRARSAAKAAPAPQARLQEAQAGTRLKVNLDGDDRPDTVTLEPTGSGVVVTVVLGANPGRPFVFRLARNPDAQDGICGEPGAARITVERCTGEGELACRPASGAGRRGEGELDAVRLDDGDCDAFHFFFDGSAVRWWRR